MLCSPASNFSGNDWGNTSTHFGRLAISGKKMPRYAYLAWKGWLAWVEGQHHFSNMASGSKPKPLRTTREFFRFFFRGCNSCRLGFFLNFGISVIFSIVDMTSGQRWFVGLQGLALSACAQLSGRFRQGCTSNCTLARHS